MKHLKKKLYVNPHVLILEVETIEMLANSLSGNGGDKKIPIPQYGDDNNSEDL